MSEHKEPIPSMIYNAAVGGHVTTSQQIIDETEDKDQSQINAEIKEIIGTGSINERIANAVNAEKDRAELAEDGLDERIDSLEDIIGAGGGIDQRIEDAVNQESIERQNEISDLKGGSSKTIQQLDTAISNEATARANAVNAETTRAQVAEQLLQEQYNALTQSDVIVGALPASGTKNKIYRVPGTSSYKDYMWNGSLFILMATYNNAIDNKPIYDSGNLVTSGGVYGNTPSNKVVNRNIDLAISDEIGFGLVTFENGNIRTKHFDSATTPNVKTVTKPADLYIIDEKGNAIAEFKNGHIKTKNFNSSNISPVDSDIYNNKFNSSLGVYGLVVKNDHIETEDNILLPFIDMTIFLNIPNNLSGNIKLYDINGILTNTIALSNRSIIKTNSARSYTLDFSGTNVEDITTCLENGTLALLFNEDTDVISSNSEHIKEIKNKQYYLNRYHAGYPSYGYRGTLLIHISDLHGDAKRLENAYKFAKNVKASALVNTGDSVQVFYTDHCDYIGELDKKYNIPTIVSLGNHDATASGYTSIDTALAYQNTLKVVAERNGYTPLGKTYFYYDDTINNIRFISVNTFEGTAVSNNVSEEQMLWFIDTLNSTPENYGVILCSHSPFVRYEHIQGGFKSFDGSDWDYTGIYADIFTNIIDAFINRDSITVSYNSVECTADFSSVDSSVEFICALYGHNHAYAVGYNSNAQSRQLVACCTLGNCDFGPQSNVYIINDTNPRMQADNVLQDSFLAILIDRIGGNVSFFPIGSDYGVNFQKYNSITLNYK